jgi:hypothetical protein
VKYYSALTKEGYPAVCNDMGEPDTLYAKWNNLVIEGEILYDSTYESSKTVKFIESSWGRERKEKFPINACKFQWNKMNEF